jgi:uncharacterized protein (TIGR03382 family)
MRKIIGAMLLVLGWATVSMATVLQNNAPEIDATTGVTALALIAGAALVIRGRRRK